MPFQLVQKDLFKLLKTLLFCWFTNHDVTAIEL